MTYPYEVFRSPHRRVCLESRLVLESVGIPSFLVQHDGQWLLVVNEQDFAVAATELEDYRRDQANDFRAATQPIPTFNGALIGVVYYVAILGAVAILDAIDAYGWNWLAIGQMQAEAVTTGQVWRTVTALTLHADVSHLLSNLVFGSLFGMLAGRVLGGGVAWLTIVFAGALGNTFAALVRHAEHTSIGASTAVFAALGILVAHALRPRLPVRESAMRRWSPLIAGVVMLAMMGLEGERTDVLAHVTGFCSGVAIGWFGCRCPERLLASSHVQLGAGLAALAMVIVGWLLAVWLA